MFTYMYIAEVKLFMDLSWTGSATHFSLWGFIALYMILLGWIVAQRSLLTLQGKFAANEFSTTGEEISPLAQRLCRAHANLYESFPVWGGFFLMAIVTDSTSITNGLAVFLLLARIGQIVTHLISTSALAVTIRFVFFSIQFLIAMYWIVGFARKFFT